MKDNKLIAEFMGEPYYYADEERYYYADDEGMEFHTSWDWLMPVLKKIYFKLNPETYGAWRMISRPTEYNIEEVYAQAVRFIKQYNDEKRS